MGSYTNLHFINNSSIISSAAVHQCISASGASAHQQHHWINSLSASEASAHQQHQCISSSSTSAHQQLQRISSISATAASVHQQHQCISYRHWKIYLPIYIKSGHISLYPLTSPDKLQTPPDMLQTPPDTIRHGPDTTRYHHTCIMYGLYGLKHHIVQISGDVTIRTDGRTDNRTTRKHRATQLLIWEPLSFAMLNYFAIMLVSFIWLNVHYDTIWVISAFFLFVFQILTKRHVWLTF